MVVKFMSYIATLDIQANVLLELFIPIFFFLSSLNLNFISCTSFSASKIRLRIVMKCIYSDDAPWMSGKMFSTECVSS